MKNAVISGLIGGLIYVLIVGRPPPGMPPRELSGALMAVLGVALMFGAIGGLGVASLNHITLVESMSWKWNQFWKKTIPGSIVGLIVGLILELIVSLILGPIFGLTLGLIGGLILGASLGWTRDRKRPFHSHPRSTPLSFLHGAKGSTRFSSAKTGGIGHFII